MAPDAAATGGEQGEPLAAAAKTKAGPRLRGRGDGRGHAIQSQRKQMCESRSDRGWGRANRPVVDVSWEYIVQYLDWLSDATGRRYRLPSEDEWEYAARAGAGERVGPPPLFTDPRLAWAAAYVLEARKTKKTKPVDSGEGNAFGVFGTEGNVWEWTDSCWQRTYETGAEPVSRRNCGIRVLQGEHKSYMPTFVRDIGSGGCSIRPMPGNFGFRVVREL